MIDSWNEKEFTYLGFPCVCKALAKGHRTGYVGVKEDHPLYGKDAWENYQEVSQIIVHWGISYCQQGDGEYLDDKYWWFGFDCAHAGDKIDVSILIDPVYKKCIGDYFGDGTVKTVEFVEQECKKLAEQLVEYLPEDKNMNSDWNFVNLPEIERQCLIYIYDPEISDEKKYISAKLSYDHESRNYYWVPDFPVSRTHKWPIKVATAWKYIEEVGE